jgi:hypothetical protein
MVFDMGNPDEPAETGLNEFLHGHPIASGHLVVASRQHVIKVAAAMNVLIHINIVRAHLQFRFESCSAWFHMTVIGTLWLRNGASRQCERHGKFFTRRDLSSAFFCRYTS